MPKVATIMDGIKFAQGTMAAERRSRSERRWLRVDTCVLFQRDENKVARLVADDAGHMAAPRGVFGEHHIAWPETANGAVAGFDLDLAGQSDDILSSRHAVIAAPMARSSPNGT